MSEQEQHHEQEVEHSEEEEEEKEPDADIDESDVADGADVFEAVDADLDADLDEDEDEDESDGADESESEDVAAADESASQSGDVSLGHVYCRGLGVATSVAVDRCREDDDRDREEIIEEYSTLAKQMEIDQYVDQHVEQSGGIEQMSPGKAALLMTGAMVVMVAVSEPAVTDAALDGADLPDALPL